MTLELPVIARVAAALVVALLISFISTPVVKSIAQRVGAMDIPKDNRRMHHHPIPRMGGLAIFLGFLLSALIFVPMDQANRGMLLGAVVIVILGIFDDIYALPALPKLLVQIGAALIAVLHGNVIEVLSNPNLFSENPYWSLGSLAIPLSVIWSGRPGGGCGHHQLPDHAGDCHAGQRGHGGFDDGCPSRGMHRLHAL